MGLRQLEIFFTLTVRGSTLTIKLDPSDVYRRQILMIKVDPRTVRVNLLVLNGSGMSRLVTNIPPL